MKMFGKWSEQTSSLFRTSSDNKILTLAVPSTLTGASLTLTLPDNSGTTDTLVSRTSTDTGTNRLKNKHLSSDTVLINDGTDITKLLSLDLSAITTGTTRSLKMANAAVDLANLTNSNISASAAIIYSKLSLTNSIVNADIATAAGIAYSKLTLTGSIVNADIGNTAAIAYSKMASLTNDRALISSGSGSLITSTVTATELGYSSGVTSAIQTQLDAKQLRSTLTAKGDLYVATASGVTTRLPVGSDGAVLTADSAQTTGFSYTSPLTNPMDGPSQLIVGGVAGAATKLDTSLLGDLTTSVLSQSYAVTAAAPGVFTVAVAPATGTSAYVTVTQNGFTASTRYYVTKVSATTFKLATTLSNAITSVNITSSGTTAGTIITGGTQYANLDAARPGTISGNNITAGYIGEVRETAVTSAVASGVTANQFGNVTTITLDPGHWIIYSAVKNTRTSGQAEITAAISINTGNTVTDHANMVNEIAVSAITTGAGNSLITLPPRRVSLSVSTTYYLKAKLDVGTWTQANFAGYISAQRTA